MLLNINFLKGLAHFNKVALAEQGWGGTKSQGGGGGGGERCGTAVIAIHKRSTRKMEPHLEETRSPSASIRLAYVNASYIRS